MLESVNVGICVLSKEGPDHGCQAGVLFYKLAAVIRRGRAGAPAREAQVEMVKALKEKFPAASRHMERFMILQSQVDVASATDYIGCYRLFPAPAVSMGQCLEGRIESSTNPGVPLTSPRDGPQRDLADHEATWWAWEFVSAVTYQIALGIHCTTTARGVALSGSPDGARAPGSLDWDYQLNRSFR
eukprot:5490781-Amphidinium_carterae.1